MVFIFQHENPFDNSFALSLKYICVRRGIKLDGQCLKQGKVTFEYLYFL